MDKKLNRLKRWLESEDKSFHHTTEDRAVEPICSDKCYYWEHVDELKPENCEDCIHHYECATPKVVK